MSPFDKMQVISYIQQRTHGPEPYCNCPCPGMIADGPHGVVNSFIQKGVRGLKQSCAFFVQLRGKLPLAAKANGQRNRLLYEQCGQAPDLIQCTLYAQACVFVLFAYLTLPGVNAQGFMYRQQVYYEKCFVA